MRFVVAIVFFSLSAASVLSCGDSSKCVPSCGDRKCGDDQCGGSCGSCSPPQICAAGACVSGIQDAGADSGPAGLDAGFAGTDAGPLIPDAGAVFADAGNSSQCSISAPNGQCPFGQTCVGGSCCGNACGSSCCGSSDVCVGGSCCPSERACAGICCNAGSICYSDASGNLQCGQTCANTTDCGTDCCGVLQGGGGVCVTQDGTWSCACNTLSDCSGLPSTTACAPIFSGLGGSEVVAGPYICKPDDGQPGDGCNGLTVTCSGSSWHCATDSRGNQYCTTYCSGDATCGNPGVACCDVWRGSSAACGLCSNP